MLFQLSLLKYYYSEVIFDAFLNDKLHHIAERATF